MTYIYLWEKKWGSGGGGGGAGHIFDEVKNCLAFQRFIDKWCCMCQGDIFLHGDALCVSTSHTVNYDPTWFDNPCSWPRCAQPRKTKEILNDPCTLYLYIQHQFQANTLRSQHNSLHATIARNNTRLFCHAATQHSARKENGLSDARPMRLTSETGLSLPVHLRMPKPTNDQTGHVDYHTNNGPGRLRTNQRQQTWTAL